LVISFNLIISIQFFCEVNDVSIGFEFLFVIICFSCILLLPLLFVGMIADANIYINVCLSKFLSLYCYFSPVSLFIGKKDIHLQSNKGVQRCA